MIKREIKDFKLSFDGASGYPVTLPFTLFSALSDMGCTKRQSIDTGECRIEAASASAVFSVEDVAFGGKFSYISVLGVQTPAKIYLNKTELCKLDGKRRKYLIDASAAVKNGENLIEIEFLSPDFSSGILGSLEFLKFNNSIIEAVRVKERHDGEGVSLELELDLIGDTANARAVATLISGSGQIYYGGFGKGRATVNIKDPLYWWPKGLGVQNVYKLSVNLYGEDEVEDSAEFKIGLRTLLPDAKSGGVLLSANGVSFIPMGAVYVPEKNYLPEESRKRTAAFVTSAAMAGFNTFVISDAGELPSDEFFDLCDVHGIAVICQINSLDFGAIANISRLAHHPSFAPIDIVGLSSDEREELLAELLRTAPAASYSFFDRAPEYFGEESIPSDKTLNEVVKADDRNVFSEEMERHSGGKVRDMACSVSEHYLYAYNPSDFSYLTRLSQAKNTRREMLARRCELGRAGRAVFSSVGAQRLISDSSLDKNASWKALQYHAAKFFSPVVIEAEISGCSVTFTASNAGKAAVFGTLEYKIIDSSNLVICKNSEEIDISEGSATTLFTRDFTEHIASHERDRFIEYSFTEGGHAVYRGVSLFVEPKYFNYEKPCIDVEIEGKDKRFSITLSADKYVGALELSFTDVDAVFSDNYFDITSPMPIKINVTLSAPLETVKSLKKQLKIRSLYDIGKF